MKWRKVKKRFKKDSTNPHKRNVGVIYYDGISYKQITKVVLVPTGGKKFDYVYVYKTLYFDEESFKRMVSSAIFATYSKFGDGLYKELIDSEYE